jgi:N-acetylmuramoyl-L-alanine amidase
MNPLTSPLLSLRQNRSRILPLNNTMNPMKNLLLLIAFAMLSGCVTGPVIDYTYSAKSQSSRVKYIVIHYTVSDLPQSIKILSQGEVSSHYLVTNETKPVIYQLVDESRQANHAGVSNWKNHTLLNGSSVGIEIVNFGYKNTPEGRIWEPFPQAQVDHIVWLVRQIAERHKVPPENILGHSDIAPQRKQDPGPMFPWIQLAKAGLIVWPDAEKVALARAVFDLQMPDTAWVQAKLAQHGYAVPQNGQLDLPTRTVVSAFQMKYRPANIDGIPDAETASLLEALTKR